MRRITIIGGAAEARDLARALPGARVLLPVPERTPGPWPRPVEAGPLPDGWLDGTDTVVEAAHPCDDKTAFAVARACRAAGVHHVQLVRPPWRATARDTWVSLKAPQDAALVIPPSAHVLVTTGRALLPGLRRVRATCLVRHIGAHPGGYPPLPRARYLCGEGPFSLAHEIALMRRERIDWLLLRNAGGRGSWPKLEAARHLRLPVAMLDRPRRPDGPRVTSVEEAVRWIQR
ncbi:precorrin-6A/cobalt-precorrin-6A reductase [Pacificoceanicola onchidii]|uniref:precorrin-6A/cobalt-precorrin-6A reductase n=1 Tax=Pacificoceanicola onchidii TaxID=2562685 RepID=UPI0010A352BA|nr:precorrin-6A/cobalt-precorrin-6A reductase [Pacificoceanicola onchidii]